MCIKHVVQRAREQANADDFLQLSSAFLGGVVSVAKPVSNVILVELLKHVRPWLKPALTSHC